MKRNLHSRRSRRSTSGIWITLVAIGAACAVVPVVMNEDTGDRQAASDGNSARDAGAEATDAGTGSATAEDAAGTWGSQSEAETPAATPEPPAPTVEPQKIVGTPGYHGKYEKGRVHLEGCPRLWGDMSWYVKVPLDEAKANGRTLCAFCPGSTLPRPKVPHVETWVNPPPDGSTWQPELTEYKTPECAPLISIGEDGKLVYKPFTEKGDKLWDYSQCGYKRSEVPIPNVRAVVTLSPPFGATRDVSPLQYPVGPDSRETIQKALDRVAAMRPDANGNRGAVLLKKGTWHLSGSLLIQDGVVLRGEGDGEDGTILLISKPKGAGKGGTGITLGGTGSRNIGIKLAGTVMKEGDWFRLKLADGSIFPMRNKKGVLKDSHVGKNVILSFGGTEYKEDGRRKVSFGKTFPTGLEPWSAAKAPRLDPDLTIPGLIKPGAKPAALAAEPSGPSSSKIVDAYVPTGASRITVENASGFKAGDWISVQKKTNKAWVEAIGCGERLRHIRAGKHGYKKPWGPGDYGHLRRVKAVDGNTITLDIQMPQSIAQEHGGGYVRKASPPGVRNCGVEHLRIVSNYDKTKPANPGKGTDCRNLATGVGVKGMDSWVRNVSVLHTYFASVQLGGAVFCTVRDCKYLKPIGPKRGGHRYSFSIGGGLGNLVYRCFSEDARHDFVIGARMAGPHVFLECSVEEGRGGNAEPHHRWGVGVLWDNVNAYGCTMNRGDSGSGHGWAGANSLFWNTPKGATVYDVETEGENNFAIGYTGTTKEFGVGGLWYANTRAGYWGTPFEGKFYGYALSGSGHIESPDKPAEPRSLFKRQLIERIGEARAEAVLK